MREGGGGSIITMDSSYGIRCEPGFLASDATNYVTGQRIGVDGCAMIRRRRET
jgi:hypothetical protein